MPTEYSPEILALAARRLARAEGKAVSSHPVTAPSESIEDLARRRLAEVEAKHAHPTPTSQAASIMKQTGGPPTAPMTQPRETLEQFAARRLAEVEAKYCPPPAAACQPAENSPLAEVIGIDEATTLMHSQEKFMARFPYLDPDDFIYAADRREYLGLSVSKPEDD